MYGAIELDLQASYSKNENIAYFDRWTLFLPEETVDISDFDEEKYSVLYYQTDAYWYVFSVPLRLLYRENASFDAEQYLNTNKIPYETYQEEKLIACKELTSEQEQICFDLEKGNATSFIKQETEFYKIERFWMRDYFSTFQTYKITDRKTNESRTIDLSDIEKISETELGIYLSEKGLEPQTKDVILVNDQIYFWCRFDRVKVLYLFNFQTSEMVMVDWVILNIPYSSQHRIYFFNVQSK